MAPARFPSNYEALTKSSAHENLKLARSSLRIPVTAFETGRGSLHNSPGRQSGRRRLLAVLVPIYCTPMASNFLWFCDTALLLTVAGMWMESSLLISMCAVGILIPQASGSWTAAATAGVSPIA